MWKLLFGDSFSSFPLLLFLFYDVPKLSVISNIYDIYKLRLLGVLFEFFFRSTSELSPSKSHSFSAIEYPEDLKARVNFFIYFFFSVCCSWRLFTLSVGIRIVLFIFESFCIFFTIYDELCLENFSSFYDFRLRLKWEKLGEKRGWGWINKIEYFCI